MLCGMKPAVDAYRVATNRHDDKATVNPLQEMVFGKCIELACESAPGGERAASEASSKRTS